MQTNGLTEPTVNDDRERERFVCLHSVVIILYIVMIKIHCEWCVMFAIMRSLSLYSCFAFVSSKRQIASCFAQYLTQWESHINTIYIYYECYKRNYNCWLCARSLREWCVNVCACFVCCCKITKSALQSSHRHTVDKVNFTIQLIIQLIFDWCAHCTAWVCVCVCLIRKELWQKRVKFWFHLYLSGAYFGWEAQIRSNDSTFFER